MLKISVPVYQLCLLMVVLPFLFTGSLAAQQPDSSQLIRSSSSDISLTTRVEATEVALDQLVVFYLELSWSGEMDRYKIAPLDQPVLTNLVMEGSGSKNQLHVGPDGTRSVKTITYQLKSLELGMSYIDGMVIRYRDSQSGKEDQLLSQRVAIKIVPGSKASDSNVTAMIYILLLLLFGTALAFFLMQYLRKRKQPLREITPEKMVAPETAYLLELKSVVEAGINDGSKAVERLSKLVRDYLFNEFAISRSTSSHEEILAKLGNAIDDPQDLQQMDELFRQLNVIKFAGSSIDPSQLSNIFGIAEGFLLKRKQLWEDARRRNDAG